MIAKSENCIRAKIAKRWYMHVYGLSLMTDQGPSKSIFIKINQWTLILVIGITERKYSYCFSCFSFAPYTGAVFLHDCRANEMVPVYLVIHGVMLIIAIIIGLLQTRSDKYKKKDSKKKKTPKENCIELISTLIHVFLIAWFFYGKCPTTQFREKLIINRSACITWLIL